MALVSTRSHLLKTRVDRFRRVLRGVEQGDVRALHRARVASRRLRELLPVLQLDHDVAAKLTRRLRRVTTRLGAVRELDVLLHLIDELHVSRRDRSAALGRVGIAVAKARDDARKRLSDRLPIKEMWKLAAKLGGAADDLAGAEASAPGRAARSWRWAIDARIAGRASRLTTAIHHAGAVYLPERLHEVRLGVKKLRYALELSSEVSGWKREAELREFKRAQGVLGRMHDLQILIERVRQVQASLAPPSVTVWHELDTLVVSLEDECRRLHGRYMRARDTLCAMADTLSVRALVPAPGHTTRRAG